MLRVSNILNQRPISLRFQNARASPKHSTKASTKLRLGNSIFRQTDELVFFPLSLDQLLGDYDKVKAVSEGSDCQCKCVVRPLGRDACQRVNEGTSRPEDFYVVETITSGPECRCSCVAPPSALNPCEGDFRLKKLREADSKDFKVFSLIVFKIVATVWCFQLLKQ